jgi:hypothetical protein
MNDEENISYFFKLFKFIILIIFPEHTVRAYSMEATSKQYFKVIFKLEIYIYVKENLPIWI